MKRVVLLAAALTAAGAVTASAADFGVPSSGPSTPSFYVAPTSSPSTGGQWSGFYVGGLAGYIRATFDDGAPASAAGLMVGGYAGVNIQSNAIVLGVEVGGAYSRVDDGTGNGIGWEGELRGRAGFAVGRLLIYGAGGLVIAGVRTDTPSDTRETGWTVAGGGEFAIGQALTARVEYTYQRFGEIGAAAPTTLTARGVRAGVGLHF